MARTLVAGVGYRNLRDLSVGPVLVDELGRLGDDVDVEDLSFSPIDVLHQLRSRPPYRALIVIAGCARGDVPGTIRRAPWSSPSPAEAVVTAINESLTGVISHANLLHVLAHFGALPERAIVYEIEPAPADQGWGAELSVPVAHAMREVTNAVRREIGA